MVRPVPYLTPLFAGGVWRGVRFLLIFASVFLITQRLYIMTGETFRNHLNQNLNALPTSWLLNLVLPREDVTASGGTLTGANGYVDINKGCEGVEVMLMLASGIIAYPARWAARVIGMVWGLVFVYLLNLVRIGSLYAMMVFRPQWFDVAHVSLWQTVMILLAMVYFLIWMDRAAPKDSTMRERDVPV